MRTTGSGETVKMASSCAFQFPFFDMRTRSRDWWTERGPGRSYVRRIVLEILVFILEGVKVHARTCLFAIQLTQTKYVNVALTTFLPRTE